MSDPNKYDGEVESLKSLYNYWQQNGEYDGVAVEYVEAAAQDINWRELQDKLAGASDLDMDDGHEYER